MDCCVRVRVPFSEFRKNTTGKKSTNKFGGRDISDLGVFLVLLELGFLCPNLSGFKFEVVGLRRDE